MNVNKYEVFLKTVELGSLTKAGDVQSQAVYPLASNVARNPPLGKDDASGSPFI